VFRPLAVIGLQRGFVADLRWTVRKDGRYYGTATAGGSGGRGCVFELTLAAATITIEPQSQTVTAGQNPRFAVAAIGTPAPTYQWQVSTNGGLAWSNLLSNTSLYSGVTTNTLTVSSATVELNATLHRCGVTNSSGSATSSAAMLTVVGPVSTRGRRPHRGVSEPVSAATKPPRGGSDILHER
jgi:uncharacterized repeat protein (TIGR03803 family)